MSKDLCYGWFSEEHAEKSGYDVYATPSGDVKITTLTSDKKEVPNWDDIKFVGMIDTTKFIKRFDGEWYNKQPRITLEMQISKILTKKYM